MAANQLMTNDDDLEQNWALEHVCDGGNSEVEIEDEDEEELEAYDSEISVAITSHTSPVETNNKKRSKRDIAQDTDIDDTEKTKAKKSKNMKSMKGLQNMNQAELFKIVNDVYIKYVGKKNL